MICVPVVVGGGIVCVCHSSIHPFVHLFVQAILMEHLLCARHCSKGLGHVMHEAKIPAVMELASPGERQTINVTNTL